MKERESRKDIDNMKIETGKRTFFINVVGITSSNKKYIKLSERISKDDGTHYYDKVIIHEEDLEDVCIAFSRMLKHFKVNNHLAALITKRTGVNMKNNDKPWNAQDDLKLEKLYCKRKSVEELSTIFERNKQTIELRIERLKLKDKYDFDVDSL